MRIIELIPEFVLVIPPSSSEENPRFQIPQSAIRNPQSNGLTTFVRRSSRIRYPSVKLLAAGFVSKQVMPTPIGPMGWHEHCSLDWRSFFEKYNGRDHGGDVARCFVVEDTEQNCRLSGWDDGGHAGYDSLLDSETNPVHRGSPRCYSANIRTESDA